MNATTATTRVIQRVRTRGSHNVFDVQISRPSRWANPWTAKPSRFGLVPEIAVRTTQAAVRNYARWIARYAIARNPMFRDPPTVEEIREALRGKILACWCKRDSGGKALEPCHGDVLAAICDCDDDSWMELFF